MSSRSPHPAARGPAPITAETLERVLNRCARSANNFVHPEPDVPFGDERDDGVVTLLRHHVFGVDRLTDSDLARIVALANVRCIDKGSTILSPGEICSFAAFVIRGCLRVYFTECDGSERVLSFAPEGWWVSDVDSLLSERSSALRIAAIEPSQLLMIDRAALTLIDAHVSGGDHLIRGIAEQTLVMLQRRLAGSMRKSAAQRYTEFQRLYPGLDRRIPQYQVAAYLGISPEFLSKLLRRNRV